MNKKNTKKKNFNPEGNSLNLYMKEISRYPLLSREEEESLARLAAEGDTAAKDKLVKSNLRFVINVAKKYQGNGLPLEDLISEGNLGLLTAVKRFDVEKGYRFITYAVWWIRQSITKAIYDKGRMIRLPKIKNNQLSKLDKTSEEVQVKTAMGSNREIERIAKVLMIPEKKAKALMNINYEVLSLDEPTTKENNSLTLNDLVEDDCNKSPIEAITDNDLRNELENVIDNLGKKSAEIIRSRYGLGNSGVQTLQEIGDRLNLSRERVRQIENRAKAKIQQSPMGAILESYIA